MVGAPGVSSTSIASCSTPGTSGTGEGIASRLAAKSPVGQETNVSSPTAVGARNSSEAEPPIAPDIADTTR